MLKKIVFDSDESLSQYHLILGINDERAREMTRGMRNACDDSDIATEGWKVALDSINPTSEAELFITGVEAGRYYERRMRGV